VRNGVIIWKREKKPVWKGTITLKNLTKTCDKATAKKEGINEKGQGDPKSNKQRSNCGERGV